METLSDDWDDRRLSSVWSRVRHCGIDAVWIKEALLYSWKGIKGSLVLFEIQGAQHTKTTRTKLTFACHPRAKNKNAPWTSEHLCLGRAQLSIELAYLSRSLLIINFHIMIRQSFSPSQKGILQIWSSSIFAISKVLFDGFMVQYAAE